MEPTVTIRPLFGRVLAVITVLIILLCVVAFVYLGNAEALLRYVWPLLFLGYMTWLAFWQPRVVISPGGIQIRNVFRTIDLPWPSVRAVDTRFALTIDSSYGKFSAWSAPAPDRHTLSRAAANPRAGNGAPAADAAEIIRRHRETLGRAGYMDNPLIDPDHRAVRVHTVEIVVLCALGVASLAGLLL